MWFSLMLISWFQLHLWKEFRHKPQNILDLHRAATLDSARIWQQYLRNSNVRTRNTERRQGVWVYQFARRDSVMLNIALLDVMNT